MYSISTMLQTYNRHRKNEGGYIIGFYVNDKVYFIKRKTLPHDTLYIDKSTGNLRMRYSEKLVQRWLSKAVECGLSQDLNDDKYNKGYMFEQMIYNYFNLEWIYDNVSFYEGNDITLDNKGYSIKLLKNCTICKYNTIQKLRKYDRLHA